jgi:hypothetical protein
MNEHQRAGLQCSPLCPSLQVASGATLELTLAQFWSSLGAGRLRVEIVFHGIEARREVFLDGSRTAKLHIRSLKQSMHDFYCMVPCRCIQDAHGA